MDFKKLKKGRKHMQKHTLKIKSELLCPEDEMTFTYAKDLLTKSFAGFCFFFYSISNSAVNIFTNLLTQVTNLSFIKGRKNAA